jgi:hypothetical protein
MYFTPSAVHTFNSSVVSGPASFSTTSHFGPRPSTTRKASAVAS